MLWTREQLEQLENALWREWSAGMKARPELKVKNQRTNYGSFLNIDASLVIDQLANTGKMVQVSDTLIQNVIHDITGEFADSVSVFASVTEHYFMIDVYAHWHKR